MNPDQLCMGCMDDSGGAAVCPHCGRAADTPTTSPLHLRPRTVLHNQYLIGRVLGHGGFGVTYLGWDLNLARRLAVKEYLPHGVATRTLGDPTVAPYSGQNQRDFEWGLEKFLDEARVLARFQNHPGIVAVLNFFRENGTAYLVMEYLHGSTLQEYLARKGGRIAFDWAVRIMMPVMDALREVHKAGILHRDVSPDNVYLSNNGQVKVLDFGAARYALSQQSRNLSVILKEGFAPEEQYRSKGNQGPWTDVYAVAATLYRAITGVVPQPALDRLELDELAPPSALGVAIPPDREATLMKALAVRAVNRFQSMEDFQAEISGVAKAAATSAAAVAPAPSPAIDTAKTRIISQPLPPPPPPPISDRPTPSPAPTPPVTKLPTKWIAALAAFILLVGGFAVYSAVKSFRGRQAAAVPVIHSFVAQPSRIQAGQTTALNWNVDNAVDVLLEPGEIAVPSFGGKTVSPDKTTTYKLNVRNMYGIVSQEVTVTVDAGRDQTARGIQPKRDQPQRDQQSTQHYDQARVREQQRQWTPPVQAQTQQKNAPAEIIAFRPVSPVIAPGQSTVLAWSVRNAAYAYISGIGRVPPQGTARVSPASNMTYELVAVDASGARTSAQAEVRVASQAAQNSGPYDGSNQEQQQQQQPTRRLPPAFSMYVEHEHEAGGAASAVGGVLGRLGRGRYTPQNAGTCSGQLRTTANNIIYTASDPNHSFDVPLSSIVEVRQNSVPLRGMTAFHIRFADGDNYNFIPRSGSAAAAVSAITQAMR